MPIEFKVTKRPRFSSSKVDEALIKALMETLTDEDKSVEVVIKDQSEFNNWQQNLRMFVAKQNPPMRLRTKRNKISGKVCCWLEKQSSRDRIDVTDVNFGVTDESDEQFEDPNE